MERADLVRRLQVQDKYPGLLTDEQIDEAIELALDELNGNVGGKLVEGEYGTLLAAYPDVKIIRTYDQACTPIPGTFSQSSLFYTSEDDGVLDCGAGGSWAVGTVPFTLENIDSDSFMFNVFLDYVRAFYHEILASRVFASKGVPDRPFDLAADELLELADKYRERARQKLEEQWIYKFV